jgi:uncharacterized protein YifN (PemK superfamily)
VPINEHPETGMIVVCDFSTGFKEPEMVKRRPVIVLSPKIARRANVCTIVPLSTVPPAPPMPFHCELVIQPVLPPPFHEGPNWVKSDMVTTVGFYRLDLVRLGKDRSGKRIYRWDRLSAEQLKQVRKCVLNGIGLAGLTKHLP